MQDQSAVAIIKRVGKALIAVGLLDIGLMIYCIIHGISYSSSLNIFAIAGGIFLLRRSFRAASYIRRITIFLLSFGLSALALGIPFLFPISLLIIKVRLQPSFLLFCAAEVLFVMFSFWIIHELGNEAVLKQISFTKVRKVSNVFLAFSGSALGAALVLFLTLLFNGTDATQAKAIARSQLGSDYQYTVTSLNITTSSGKGSVSGVVTAWNKAQIREIPIHWQTN